MATNEFYWIDPEKTPFDFPILDIRSFTEKVTSTTSDPKVAETFGEVARSNGLEFLDKAPMSDRKIETDISYHCEGEIMPGILFSPRAMEHKYAIYYYEKKIIFVKSWLKDIRAIAEVDIEDNLLTIKSITGFFAYENEPAELTTALLDFVINSHVLNLPAPLPIIEDFEEDLDAFANWAFLEFGNMAKFAAKRGFSRLMPVDTIQTTSLLHYYTATNRIPNLEAIILKGHPLDVLDKNGLSALHWACSKNGLPLVEFFIKKGLPVDFPSKEGATPLMQTVQNDVIDIAKYLIAQGADVNAGDTRGFTSLHRAAEMGRLEFVRLLLANGAKQLEVQGHTPMSLAKMTDRADIIALLSE